jgi:hypothetical protein
VTAEIATVNEDLVKNAPYVLREIYSVALIGVRHVRTLHTIRRSPQQKGAVERRIT